MSKYYAAELDRHFAWFEARLPPRPAKFVRWLRKPSSRLVRIPLALLLVLGGVFSFLPILGLWMPRVSSSGVTRGFKKARPAGGGIAWSSDP